MSAADFLHTDVSVAIVPSVLYVMIGSKFRFGGES